VSVLGSADGKEITEVGVDFSNLFVNKTQSTERTPELPVMKNYMTAPYIIASDEPVLANLTVFLDGRVVESFVGGVPLTTLVYPKHNSSTLLGLFMRCGGSSDDEGESERAKPLPQSSVTVDVQAWALRPIVISNASSISV
jgi:hypothetical protein